MDQSRSIVAIVPLKPFSEAKQRLKSELTSKARADLAKAMAADVLTALKAAVDIGRILVVSRDPEVAELAVKMGVECFSTQLDRDLNAAIGAVVQFAYEDGASACLIVPGDLPLITGKVIDRFVRECAGLEKASDCVVLGLAASQDGTGTNLLFSSLPTSVPFSYGPGSYNRHVSAARASGCVLYQLADHPELQDIDRINDLQNLRRLIDQQGYICGVETRKVLGSIGSTSAKVSDQRQYRTVNTLIDIASQEKLTPDQIAVLANWDDLAALMTAAARMRDDHFGPLVTYSRKVFIPLTQLCRDVCHYCTFAISPREASSLFMSVDEVLSVAKQGAAQGCKEALFTLGERPELRYKAARKALDDMGFGSTLYYVAHVAEIVLSETGLLPHINAGCMSAEEFAMLRPVSASMGMMLESTSERLCKKGGPHYGSPDKHPAARLETIALAGQADIPFTTGILIGIGETRAERVESLLAIHDLHERYGHIQEVIIQNFVPKDDTKMRAHPASELSELLWTIAIARLIFGKTMSIQAPPNLNMAGMRELISAGLNDWGGVSPVTPDYVNPENPWPHLHRLEEETRRTGKHLQERMTIYPSFAHDLERWTDSKVRRYVLRHMDGAGLAREDDWLTGQSQKPPEAIVSHLNRMVEPGHIAPRVRDVLREITNSGADHLGTSDIATLFEARSDDLRAVCVAADQMRQDMCGDAVTYIVNRNINYTNICTYKCRFCAFSKGKKLEHLRGTPYNLPLEEIKDRTVEAWDKGAREVCLQGGIHPDFTGETYLNICHVIKEVQPDMHIHAFSPLEVWHGATSLGLSLPRFLSELKAAGLDTLPGTAAEILDDEVREVLCPDKLNTDQWFEVIETAHSLDIKTTSTIMFGHVDRYVHWARHLVRLRDAQRQAGGFTEFVPLPFVADEAPIYLKGGSRRGPTFRESLLIHAVARLILAPHISNIQTSWVKMGRQGAQICLNAGANDLGGTLMDESITRAAGAKHGQEFGPEDMKDLILAIDRTPQQRTTLYRPIVDESIQRLPETYAVAAL